MAEKKLTKRKKKNQGEEGGALTKDEEEVAKYLRFNLESKKSSLLGDEAYYFFGSKAVDFLMDSKWASTTKSSVAFTHRESVCAFLSKLLSLRYFDHVHVIKTGKKLKKKDGEKEEKEDKKKEADKKKSEKSKIEEKEKDKDKDEKKTPGSPKAKSKEGKETKKVRKKVKINLEPHEDQIFHDCDDEAYVWIYDPVSWKTFFFGILLVLAIIAVCLFPLWPENVREYSWYLSVAGAIFVGSILVLAVLRYIFYGIIWVCTMGKLHFWLLPNLTAECGFFESFVPLYEYSITKPSEDGEKEKEGKKRKKSKTTTRDDSSHKDISSEVNNEKDNEDNEEVGEEDTTNTSQDVSSLSIDNEFENVSKEEGEQLENQNGLQSEGIEEIAEDEISGNCSAEEIEEDGMDLDTEEQCNGDGFDDEEKVELIFDEKIDNESGESNGSSSTTEGWVKVKNLELDEELSCNENENTVNC